MQILHPCSNILSALASGKTAEQCKEFVETHRYLFGVGALAATQMYKETRDGARMMAVLEQECEAADEMNRIEDRVEKRQRKINDTERELVAERDLFNLLVSYGQAVHKTAVQDFGVDEADFLKGCYAHLHPEVHDFVTDKLKPQALGLFEDLFDFADFTMETLHYDRLEEEIQAEIDGHAKRYDERESAAKRQAEKDLQEMRVSMRKEVDAFDSEEDDQLGRSLAAAKAAADGEDASMSRGSSVKESPDRKKTPEEAAAQVLKAIEFSKAVESATATTRPRTMSDNSSDDDQTSSFWQKANTRRSMSALISPDVQPKTKKTKTLEGEVKVGALKNDEDFE